jgi:hypothetical protein
MYVCLYVCWSVFLIIRSGLVAVWIFNAEYRVLEFEIKIFAFIIVIWIGLPSPANSIPYTHAHQVHQNIHFCFFLQDFLGIVTRGLQRSAIPKKGAIVLYGECYMFWFNKHVELWFCGTRLTVKLYERITCLRKQSLGGLKNSWLSHEKNLK